jgi:hypothetical protein
VIVFTPIARAMFEMDQDAALPLAPPEDEAIDHVTVIVPDPPAAEPERFTVVAVVVEGVAFTDNVNKAGGGELLCAAYIVWIAAMSPG